MVPTITAFEKSPDGGRGLARDTRVRWAFEEVGQPYDVRLLPFPALKQPDHMALSPFGQIPTYEDGSIILFETGAIILHIAQSYKGLFPNFGHPFIIRKHVLSLPLIAALIGGLKNNSAIAG